MTLDYGQRVLDRRATVPAKGAWAGSLGDRVDKVIRAHNEGVKVNRGNFDTLIEGIQQLRRDTVLLRDDIEDAKHYHDRRLDEMWLVLVQAGLLPTHELHHTVRDNSDVWGRVEGCEHCADALARHPFEGSVTDRIEAERERAHAETAHFWGDDEDGDDG